MNPVAPEGFGTWSQLFDYLKSQGFADQQRVALVYPTESPETVAETNATPDIKPAAREVELYIDEVKARAFDELYERLPTRDGVGLMSEMLDAASKIVGVRSHVYPVKEFLNKLPIRND